MLKTKIIKFFLYSLGTVFSLAIFLHPVSASACTVTDAHFRVSELPGDPFDPDTFFEDSSGAYLGTLEADTPYVYVDLETEDCVGSTLGITVDIIESSPPSTGVISQYVYLGSEDIDDATIVFRAGETACGYLGVPEGGNDCDYFIKTTVDGQTGVLWKNWQGIPNNYFEYECDGLTCDEPWFQGGINQIGYVDPLDYYGQTPADTPVSEIQDDSYLAPLPGYVMGESAKLGTFLKSIFDVLTIIAGILAVIMIVIGGITYLSSDAISGHSEGREMMWNAILGLVLALGAWVILNTINPKLAEELNITIPSVILGNYNFSEPGVVAETTGSSGASSICKGGVAPLPLSAASCETCVAIPTPPPSTGSSNQAVPDLGNKLHALALAIPSISWHVTEAFPPTRVHCSQDQYHGTSVDANFVSPTTATGENVRAFIDAAKAKGLTAQYETNSQSQFNALASFGIKKGEELLFLGSWITAPHFSIYNH